MANTMTRNRTAVDVIANLKEIQIEEHKKFKTKAKAFFEFLFDATTSENKYDLPESMRSKLYL